MTILILPLTLLGQSCISQGRVNSLMNHPSIHCVQKPGKGWAVSHICGIIGPIKRGCYTGLADNTRLPSLWVSINHPSLASPGPRQAMSGPDPAEDDNLI